MTNVRARWMALAALWFIASPGCGDTTGEDKGASNQSGLGGTGTGGLATGGFATSVGATPPQTAGGALSMGGSATEIGGWMVGDGGIAFGGFPTQYGGFPNELSGGSWWGQGGAMETGGGPADLPPNGATCLCLFAERVLVAGSSWNTAVCSSDDPNVCSLQKAYCGQTCAGDSECALGCVDTFRSQVFNDAATYTYGSCSVVIRCPAPTT